MTAAPALRWGCPDAIEILPANPPRAQWLAARKTGIGGSDVAALKGESNYGTAYSVWCDKTNRGAEKLQTTRMRRGQLFEDAIAVEYAEESGIEVITGPGLLRSVAHPHMLATPDRLTADGGGLEVKYIEGWGLAKKLLRGDFPMNWWWQIVTYLAVTGRSHWRLAALVPNSEDLVIRLIERSDVQHVIDELGPFLEEWWTAHVVFDVPPNDGAPRESPSAPADNEVEALLGEVVLRDRQRHREINQQKLALEMEEVEIKARAAQELAGHKYLTVNGVRVAQMVHNRGKSGFNTKGLRAAHPEIAKEFTTQGTPYDYVQFMED